MEFQAEDDFDNYSYDYNMVTQTLGVQIYDNYAWSEFDDEGKKKFLPEGHIEELATREAVISAMYKDRYDGDKFFWEESRMERLIDFVFSKAKKVLAATIVSSLSGMELLIGMYQLMMIKFTDDSLPIAEDDLKNLVAHFKATPWQPGRIDTFCQAQWRFLAPVFSSQKFQHNLEPHHILPFTEKGTSVKQGAFGRVFKVKVHHRHYLNPIKSADGSVAPLAIKEFIIDGGDEELQKDAEEVWKKEVATLDELSGLTHDNLIQRIASITRGRQRLLMFLWADGGNLRDFWEKWPTPTVTADLVRDIVNQLRGMAHALQALHEWGKKQALQQSHQSSSEYHYRHGDIKPENILCFPEQGGSQIGRLVISDLGSAQHHSVATRRRERTGDKAWATKMYEPPESETKKLDASSRRYDIWSMGCVTTEFMVWLLYGFEELTKFRASIEGEKGVPASFFLVDKTPLKGPNGITYVNVAKVHPAVEAGLDFMSNDLRCASNTALGELLNIIKTKLLVVKIPEDTVSTGVSDNVIVTSPVDDPSTQVDRSFEYRRASASEFVDALDLILKHENSDYWLTGQRRANPAFSDTVSKTIAVPKFVVEDSPISLFPGLKPQSGLMPDRSRIPYSSASLTPTAFPGSKQTVQDYRVHLSDDWVYPVDNDFASRVLRETNTSIVPLSNNPSSSLCSKCTKMDFWSSRFRIEDQVSDLQIRQHNCDFCRMRWDASQHLSQRDSSYVSFQRVGSTLRMNDGKTPVFSILRSPELQTITPIQIGFPRLPGAKEKLHFQILREWLKNCDTNHHEPECQPRETSFVPTRLIDVETEGTDTVRLYETKKDDAFKYIALSHPWGNKPPYFRSFRRHLEEYKKGIKIESLTATFRDAVRTTRELGLQYLWIDSICILQRDEFDGGDFDQEAVNMEKVFSSAYCVLAASSAAGQSEGFLNEREGSSREFVTFNRQGQAPFYICRFLDDFNQHVLKGRLNRRGWVMQERVLSHRTIYFTDKQTYWECGEGVRCETLTKMENKLESFLGDPNFPAKITSSMITHGERIIFYQDLYKQYSFLSFTRWEDRPIAIAGLEKRLIMDLKTLGGFGIFDDRYSLLRRSLLWQRSEDTRTMRRIDFPPERNMAVPTWSWMAYEGGIDFLDLPLGGVDWIKDDRNYEIHSPWVVDGSKVSHTIDQTGSTELDAIAKEFNVLETLANEFMIIYDIPKAEGQTLKCVVMGRRIENGKPEDARHYVLFIAPKGGAVYERVGVGYMPGKFIRLSDSEALGRVKIR